MDYFSITVGIISGIMVVKGYEYLQPSLSEVLKSLPEIIKKVTTRLDSQRLVVVERNISTIEAQLTVLNEKVSAMEVSTPSRTYALINNDKPLTLVGTASLRGLYS